DIIYQHDNDSKSKTPGVMQWLSRHEIFLMDWPPYSPDLNPIENAWQYLKARLRKRHNAARTHEEVWEAAVEEWDRIPRAYIEKLYESMPRRVAQCIQNNGYHTKY
ncbi:hypothetical protein CALVIDRAFT_464042, partial [Calocera viscosa TUFC12733]